MYYILPHRERVIEFGKQLKVKLQKQAFETSYAIRAHVDKLKGKKGYSRSVKPGSSTNLGFLFEAAEYFFMCFCLGNDMDLFSGEREVLWRKISAVFDASE